MSGRGRPDTTEAEDVARFTTVQLETGLSTMDFLTRELLEKEATISRLRDFANTLTGEDKELALAWFEALSNYNTERLRKAFKKQILIAEGASYAEATVRQFGGYGD